MRADNVKSLPYTMETADWHAVVQIDLAETSIPSLPERGNKCSYAKSLPLLALDKEEFAIFKYAITFASFPKSRQTRGVDNNRT
jgi:hypothetical protein